MATLAPTPLPQHRLHLPTHRHLSQLGFVGGMAFGGLSYVVHPDVLIAFFDFVLAWYVVSYAVGRVAAHEEHRAAWIVHVLLFPVVAIAAALAADRAWHGLMLGSVLLGLVGGVLVQAGVTQLLLRAVVHDQRHDLRRRLGLE